MKNLPMQLETCTLYFIMAQLVIRRNVTPDFLFYRFDGDDFDDEVAQEPQWGEEIDEEDDEGGIQLDDMTDGARFCFCACCTPTLES